MPSVSRHYRIKLADVLEAHNTALRTGGVSGIISLDVIESAIGRPYNGYYRPIHKKAAALVESICRNHGFTDGNKRTSLILLGLLLNRSGYELVPFGDEDLNFAVENMIVAVAEGRMTFREIGVWMASRIEKQSAD